jgi:BirA family biotin operon repressor/biotin-[acetyl-CoA-carboxylase] ligase
VIAWRLEQYDALASTSDDCIRRAKSGEAEGLAILALRQTAGRGSRGRQWEAPPGNLNLSVLIRPKLPMAQFSVFPLLAGIAVADAVSAFLPADTAPVLKWPNDILLGGAKLAGVMIDAAPDNDVFGWLVIGIGINLVAAPQLADRRTTTLERHGGQADPLQAAQMVLDFLGHWIDVLDHSGVSPIIDAWQQRGHAIGTQLRLTGVHAEVTGRFAGLSPSGELLLNVGNRIERFQTGEILLGVRT